MRRVVPLTFLLLFISACNSGNSPSKIVHYKKEILETEKAFAEMAAQKGMAAAFIAFAAEDAVLNRNDSIIKGIKAIQLYFDLQILSDVELNWAPDFVDVSASGDLAYTYGNYQFYATDSLGNKIQDEGVFHTVWKRQNDGSWKFVWD